MCRWLMYIGPRIRLCHILTEPSNSLIKQAKDEVIYVPGLAELESQFAKQIPEVNAAVNADGFGIAWYDEKSKDDADIQDEYPCIFRSVTPCWSNTNLFELARVVKVTCFLAHVRRASQGGISEENCHPFRAGSLTFMHNGGLAGFKKMKRDIQQSVSDEVFHVLKGATDSEHCFLRFLANLPRHFESKFSVEELAKAVRATVLDIMKLEHKYEIKERSVLNFAVSDGENYVATRCSTSPEQSPPSLYYLAGSGFALDPKDKKFKIQPHIKKSKNNQFICSSEPLTFDDYGGEIGWKIVPLDHMVLYKAGAEAFEIRDMKLYTKETTAEPFSPEPFSPGGRVEKIGSKTEQSKFKQACEIAEPHTHPKDECPPHKESKQQKHIAKALHLEDESEAKEVALTKGIGVKGSKDASKDKGSKDKGSKDKSSKDKGSDKGQREKIATSGSKETGKLEEKTTKEKPVKGK